MVTQFTAKMAAAAAITYMLTTPLLAQEASVVQSVPLTPDATSLYPAGSVQCRIYATGEVRVVAADISLPARTTCIARCDYTGADGMAANLSGTIGGPNSQLTTVAVPRAVHAKSITGGSVMCKPF